MKAFSEFRFLSVIGLTACITLFSAFTANADETDTVPLAAPDITAMGSVIDHAGEPIGSLTLQEGPEGIVMSLSVNGIPEGRHGIHFHEKGDCSDLETFKSAGAHFVPASVEDQGAGYFDPNGGPHAGSLPNVIAHPDGRVDAEIYTDLVTLKEGPASLLDEDGSALVVHEGPDDYMSHTAAGARIACAVIERAATVEKDDFVEE